MSSLWKEHWNPNFKKSEGRPSPTLQNRKQKLCFARGINNGMYIERIPLPYLADASFEGSMTVEAAVIVPLLLFFFLNIMSAVEMIRLHGKIELALWENGRVLTGFGYVYDQISEKEAPGLMGTVISDLVMYELVKEDLGEAYLEASPLTYGKNGLVFLESSYGENDCIDVKVTYQVSPAFHIPGLVSFRMTNRYYARAWTGYGLEEEEEKETVFVTPHGVVYHEKRDCSYLNRSVKTLKLWEVYSARNSDGERYRQCQVCGGNGQQVVYLTEDGNRYHGSRECPNLNRTILVVERATALKKYRPCGKCVE